VRLRESPPALGILALSPATRPTRPRHFLPSMTRSSALAAAALALLLPACTAIIPIDVTREVPLQAPAGAFDTAQVVDLTTEAAIWDRREQVDAVSIDEVTATVASLAAGHQAGHVSLRLAFRAEGAPADGSQDVQVGAFTDLVFVEGAKVTLPGSAALDAFLEGVMQGSGRFTALATGSVDGAADAVLELGLKGSLAYKVIGK